MAMKFVCFIFSILILTTPTFSQTTTTVTFPNAHFSNGRVLDGGLFDISEVPPVLSSWTKSGIGGLTSITQTTGGRITITDTGTNTTTLASIYIPVPTTTSYRVSMLVDPEWLSGTTHVGIEVGWTDGTKYFGISLWDGATTPYIEAWSTNTSRASTTGISSSPIYLSKPFFFGLRSDGNNIYFEISSNGVRFFTIYQQTMSASFLGSSGFTNIFFGHIPQTSGISESSLITYNPNALTVSFP